jgi:hypothetical protein
MPGPGDLIMALDYHPAEHAYTRNGPFAERDRARYHGLEE